MPFANGIYVLDLCIFRALLMKRWYTVKAKLLSCVMRSKLCLVPIVSARGWVVFCAFRPKACEMFVEKTNCRLTRHTPHDWSWPNFGCPGSEVHGDFPNYFMSSFFVGSRAHRSCCIVFLCVGIHLLFPLRKHAIDIALHRVSLKASWWSSDLFWRFCLPNTPALSKPLRGLVCTNAMYIRWYFLVDTLGKWHVAKWFHLAVGKFTTTGIGALGMRVHWPIRTTVVALSANNLVGLFLELPIQLELSVCVLLKLCSSNQNVSPFANSCAMGLFLHHRGLQDCPTWIYLCDSYSRECPSFERSKGDLLGDECGLASQATCSMQF